MPAQTRSDSHIHTLFRPCLGRMDEHSLKHTHTFMDDAHSLLRRGFHCGDAHHTCAYRKKIVMTTALYFSGMRTRADFEALATVDGLESIAVQTGSSSGPQWQRGSAAQRSASSMAAGTVPPGPSQYGMSTSSLAQQPHWLPSG